MSIDWITVAAQIVNFLVLVWLLKRFLYRPILDGIDARERQIAERMAQAATIRDAAEKAEAEHRAEIARLQADQEDVIAQARKAAESERDALLAEARERLKREQAAREEAYTEEARKYRAELQLKGASALVALTRKALDDLSGAALEQHIVARAAAQIAAKADDLAAAAGDGRTAVVTTRDPLSQRLRTEIGKQFSNELPDVDLQFRTDPDQSPGLGLRLGGAQLGWTVDGYMDGLQEMLERQSIRKGQADAA